MLNQNISGDVPQKPKLRGYLHLCATFAVLVGGPLLIAHSKNTKDRVALVIYVASLIFLFATSALYHRGNWSYGARRVFKRLDHATIFFAIAGSYTAVALLVMSGWAEIFVMVLVWSGSLVGIIIRELFLDLPKKLTAIPYVVVGWSALFVLPEFWRGLSGPGLLLIVLGGVAFTFGAIVYGLKKPNPNPKIFGYHEVFHTFTIIGAGFQFAAIAIFALPRS
ncbi:MAG: hemolysin III family protein [Firmicutes bacterium]|nr:hemolysin III family protein [Bacillota bacterium]